MPPVNCSGAAYAGVSAVALGAPWCFRRTVDQFGDAEVEECDVPFGCDQHVGWLQVPVYDEVGMRVGDRGQHVEEQTKAVRDREPRGVAVAIDVLTAHVLQHQVGRSEWRDAGVVQARDMRMRQSSQDASLAGEALRGVPGHKGGVE